MTVTLVTWLAVRCWRWGAAKPDLVRQGAVSRGWGEADEYPGFVQALAYGRTLTAGVGES